MAFRFFPCGAQSRYHKYVYGFHTTYSFLRKFQHAQIVLEGKAADLVRRWHVDLRENLRNYPARHREQHSGCSFVGVLAFQVMAYRQSDRRSIELARLKNIGS